MNKEQIKKQIIQKIDENKNKTITLSQIYNMLEIPYSPELQEAVIEIVQQLIGDNLLEPLKTSPKDMRGNIIKYKILKSKENEQEIKEEIVKTLVKPINLQYYLSNPKEYKKSKETIQIINNFLKLEKQEEFLTVNERSYKLFKDEKKLKKEEDTLKKLEITYKDLMCYETFEPFFFYVNNRI